MSASVKAALALAGLICYIAALMVALDADARGHAWGLPVFAVLVTPLIVTALVLLFLGFREVFDEDR